MSFQSDTYTPARILICEGDILIVKELERHLNRLDHEIVGRATSAEEAIGLVQEFKPDLILMDIKLAGESDGIEAAEKIRIRFDIPVIYLTEFTEKDALERAKKTKPYGYLAKPVGLLELRITVETALYKHDADKRLKESEERFKRFSETSFEGIVIHREGTILDVNNAAAEMLGLRPEKLIGLQVTDFLAPSSRDLALDTISRGYTDAYEAQGLRQDGTTFWVEIRGQSIHMNGIPARVSAIRDIDERKKGENDLEAKTRKLDEHVMELNVLHRRLSYILEGTNVGAWEWNIQTGETFFNERWAEIIGYTLEEISPISIDTWLSFVHPDDLKISEALLERHFKGDLPYYECEARMRHKNGDWVWILDRGKVHEWEKDGKPLLMAGTHQDITKQKRLHEISLQAEKYKAVADLAAGVAHNFNNLLQVVLGNTDLAILELKSADFSGLESKLVEIKTASKFGAETVRRLNRFVRREKPYDHSEINVFDLSDLVEQVISMSKSTWKTEPESRGLKVCLDFHVKSGCLVKANKSELFEVLLNLIKNAVEALPLGGDIDIKTHREGDKVLLSVQDNGIGVPEENINRLFTPFYTTNVEAGRGLGLATCRSILKAHNGDITVKSQLGDGSVFTVELPYASEILEQTEGNELYEFKSLSILIVDDNQAILDILKQGLEANGHTVFAALSGQEALNIFDEATLDAVVCDLSMPDMDGWQVGQAIQERTRKSRSRPIPFIIFTGWIDEASDEQKLKASGVDLVVEKPIGPDKLLEIVFKLISEKHQSG